LESSEHPAEEERMSGYTLELTSSELNIIIVSVLLKIDRANEIVKKPKNDELIKHHRNKLKELCRLLDKLKDVFERQKPYDVSPTDIRLASTTYRP
jgi:hypothetical protein